MRRYRDNDQFVREQMTSVEFMRGQVTMHLEVDLPPGRPIARAICGGPPQLPMLADGELIDPLPVVVPTAQAQELLTQHAGPAGREIAVTLGAAGLDQRLVTVLPYTIFLDGYLNGDTRVHQAESTGAGGSGVDWRFRFVYPLRDGAEASASVPTYDDGVLVGDLVRIADTRGVRDPSTGAWTRVDDDGLALLLARRFGARPAAVAWVITALKSMQEDEADWLATIQTMRPDLSSFFVSRYAHEDQVGWLARVLWTRPELSSLAMQVHRALMNQQPATAPESRWSPGPDSVDPAA